MRPSTILSTIFSGLPSASARARWMSFSFSSAAGGHIFLADELRIGRGDLHGQVVHQFLEIVGARHEIGLAVDFHQHAQLRRRGECSCRSAPCLVVREAFLPAEAMPRLRSTTSASRQIALGFDQSALALHHPRAGALAELLY